MINIIEYKNIALNYGDTQIIDNINLQIDKGDFITIIGTSGCGKSTLLKMINGLVFPTKGDVLIHNENLKNLDIIEHRRNVGYVIQGSVLFPHMTVEKNITYVLDLYKSNSSKNFSTLIKKLMTLVDLDEKLLKRYPSQLSGGQQQRVAIARALANEPNVLLMDEPFSAVDEITRSSLQDEIKKIHKKTKTTILFVTHDIQEALRLGSKVLVMDNGDILQYDTPENILNNPSCAFVEKLVSKTKDTFN